MDKEEAGSRSGIQVIARAAAVLRALRGATTGLSLGQIADRVRLPRSTVQRIVAALQEERLVIASSAGSGIRLGPELHSLAEAARYNVADTIRPLLQELCEKTEETVDLSVLRGSAMVFIDQFPGSHRLRAVSAVGEAFPLTTTANGRACLALLPDQDIARLAKTEWAHTGESRDLGALLARIAEVREAGVAFDEDEHTKGISALGIGFTDWQGDHYAISIPVPTMRYRESRQLLLSSIEELRPRVAKLLSL
ncbi:IclR family transcriptional regulator [Corticibacterium sp. UT-5YL-CI-8]|nr:IclR family transcriptional regulator [Tianweitania sp. UT-5YL-CI-8]